MRKRALVAEFTSRFWLVKNDIREDASSHKVIHCKYLSRSLCVDLPRRTPASEVSLFSTHVWVSGQFFTQICHCSVRHWAVWRKELCEESIQWFHHYRWSEWISLRFLRFSSLLFPRRCWHEIQDVRFRLSWASRLQQFSPFSIRFVDMDSVPFLFWSKPEKRPTSWRESSSRIRNIKKSQYICSVSLFSYSMSLYIDLKTILPWKCSGWHCISVIIFWISARIPNVVNPVEIFHSNSIGSTSIRFHSLNWCDSMNKLILSFHALTGSELMPPSHSTESEKT